MKNKIIFSGIGFLFVLSCLLSQDALFVDDKSSSPVQKQEKPLQTKQTKLIPLPVVKQKPGSRTCGFHAAANATTLNVLLQENKELTRQNLALVHDTHFNRIFERMRGKTRYPQELTNIEMSSALYGEPADNVITLVARKDGMVINRQGQLQKRISYNTQDSSLYELKSSVSSQPISHFICNTGDHWVLLTQDNRQPEPTYYFADSQQNSTSAYRNLNQYLSFVDSLA